MIAKAYALCLHRHLLQISRPELSRQMLSQVVQAWRCVWVTRSDGLISGRVFSSGCTRALVSTFPGHAGANAVPRGGARHPHGRQAEHGLGPMSKQLACFWRAMLAGMGCCQCVADKVLAAVPCVPREFKKCVERLAMCQCVTCLTKKNGRLFLAWDCSLSPSAPKSHRCLLLKYLFLDA